MGVMRGALPPVVAGVEDLAGVRCAVRSAGAPTLIYATSRLVGHLASFGLL